MEDGTKFSPKEQQDALNMAHSIAQGGNLKGGALGSGEVAEYYRANGRKYDPELGLNIVFYNRPVKNERKTKLGYHLVYSTQVAGPDGKMPESALMWEQEPAYGADGKVTRPGIPLQTDCDCEEENAIRRAGKGVSTLQRVIKERTMMGIHKTPGMPIWEDKIFVKIHIPGEQRNEVDTEAVIMGDPEYPDTHEYNNEYPFSHNSLYPRHWADYKRRQNKREDGAALFGTPLGELAKEGVFILRPAMVKAFEQIGIRTVQQLLATPDSTAQHIMGYPEIKRRVQAWHDEQQAQAPQLLAQELEKRHQDEMKGVRDELEQMRGLVRALQMSADGRARVEALTAQVESHEAVKELRAKQRAARTGKKAAASPIATASSVEEALAGTPTGIVPQGPVGGKPLVKRIRHGKPAEQP